MPSLTPRVGKISAAIMLNKNITEIAFECGFENSNYYGDAFKQKNGVSPTEYRKLKGNIK